MLRRAAQYHEYQMIFGQTTVNTDGQVILKDKKGRDVMAGNGIMYAGEGAIERPLPSKGYTMKFIENLLQDIDIRSGKDGEKEVFVVGGFKNILSAQNVFIEKGYTTMNNNVEGVGDAKGLNLNYSYVKLGDVKLSFVRYRYFDSKERPQKYLSNGDPRGSWDGFITPIGMNDQGENMIEMVQLRAMKSTRITGINSDVEIASTPIDGESYHVLFQTGLIARTDIFRLFMPYGA
jgi:hypothetical protein